MLASGFLAVDHLVVSPAADRLLLPADHAEEDDDEAEEQTAAHRQADDHLWRRNGGKEMDEWWHGLFVNVKLVLVCVCVCSPLSLPADGS